MIDGKIWASLGRLSYNHGEEADTNPSDKATDVKHGDYHPSGLYDTADDEDAASHQDSPTPTQRICERCEEGADEAASREQGNDRAGAGVCIFLQEESLERVRGDDFSYHAQVIAEEE
jgi:hypothetical protein